MAEDDMLRAKMVKELIEVQPVTPCSFSLKLI